jgi:hypothetical protein
MDRYGTGAVEDEPDPDPIDDGDDRRDDDEDAVARADVIGYAETRRWFEGTVDMDEDEIPDFDEPAEDAAPSPPARSQSPPTILRLPETRPSAFPPVADTSIKAPAMLEALKTNAVTDSPKPEQAPMELEDLVTLLRSRSAPLPAFVTEEFLANAINIVPRDTRLMHEDREWISHRAVLRQIIMHLCRPLTSNALDASSSAISFRRAACCSG